MLTRFRRCVFLLAVIGVAILTGCGKSSSSSGSSSGALYVTTQGDTLVSPFRLDLGSGTLSANGAGVATGSAPAAMVMVPSGNAAFVANSQCVGGSTECDSVSSYTVNADGTLTGGGTQAVGSKPVALAVNAAGTLLFVANQGSDKVSVFTIQSGTTLSEVAGSPFPTGADPVALAVAPSGNFLYVANSVAGTVSVYSIDSAGVLASVPGSPFTGTTAVTPAGVAVAPSGNFVYVTNSGSNNVSVFAACIAVSSQCPAADGSLVEITGSPFPAGQGPTSLAITPSGDFLYVVDTDSNQVSEYRVSTATGGLTPTSPTSIVSTGARPVWVAIHPQGTWLFVANFDAASISGFKINTSGVLGPLAPVSTGGQPSAIALK